MTIDLFKIRGEELALAWAVDCLICQYTATPWGQSILRERAAEVLEYYGFSRIIDGWYHLDEKRYVIAHALQERDWLIQNYKYWGRISIDKAHLSERSRHLLTILAKLSDEYMKDDGVLDDQNLSAGQTAWGELCTYGLIHTDKGRQGQWTNAGLEVLKAFDELGPFPV